jgi:aspartyl/asparaginyl-tRNA synthetase
MKNRLDYRILDLRTMAKQSIFIISSAFCQYLREILIYNDFI